MCLIICVADEFMAVKVSEMERNALDADGDGKITREEWIAKYGSIDGFDEYDLDGVHHCTQPLITV